MNADILSDPLPAVSGVVKGSTMTKFQKLANKAKYAALVPGVFLMSSAMAEEGSAVVTSVEGAVTAATADVNAIGLAIIGVVVAVVAFNWIRRVIR